MAVLGYDPKKIFPLISNCREGMGVLWEDAKKAFDTYHRCFPGHCDMEIMAARGGFGIEEFVYFYHGLAGPLEVEWPTDICMECKGSGEVVEDGLTQKCRKCLGAGALLPMIHPGRPV